MWQETKKGLYREFLFTDFKKCFEFMSQVAEIAESQQHHPRWHNTYNRLAIWLSTHDADGQITDKDRQLAAAIDDLNPDLISNAEINNHTEPVKFIKMFADGGSRGNPGQSASGFVLYDQNDQILLQKGQYIGITTNNQAEYQAVKLGLTAARELGAREVDVFLDSLLVVNQMNGVFKVRNRDLWPIHEAIKDLVSGLKKVRFTHVPREMNKVADAEVNKALDALKTST